MEECEVDKTMIAGVQDAAKWIEQTRDIKNVLQPEAEITQPIRIFLDFDIDVWCHAKDSAAKLTVFK